VPVNEEFRRFDIQLLGDIVTNVAKFAATPPTGATLRFVTVFNPRQMVG
jgi:hypothetical protein